jgi:predicted nucleotidyltransferase
LSFAVRLSPHAWRSDVGGCYAGAVEPRARLTSSLARQCAEAAGRVLARDQRVLLVYVFGSAAAPGRQARDVDLAVLTDPALDLDELLRLRAALVEATGTPIDLVSLNEAPIVLAHEVVEAGRCLFARTPDIETAFVTRARSRYWDFKPYRDEQWRLAGERLGERRRGS